MSLLDKAVADQTETTIGEVAIRTSTYPSARLAMYAKRDLAEIEVAVKVLLVRGNSDGLLREIEEHFKQVAKSLYGLAYMGIGSGDTGPKPTGGESLPDDPSPDELRGPRGDD